MYQRILVPLDGSPLAEQVLAWAGILAKGTQAGVELLRVVEPPPIDLSDSAHGMYPHRVSASIASHAQDYLESLAIPLRQEGLSVSSIVREESPSTSIISEAAKEPDTLVAMTTHGRSGISRWLLGSVMDKVLHVATNPLLIVRAQEPGKFNPEVKLTDIIVPLDGSRLAEQVVPHAVALAQALNLRIILVRVSLPAEDYYHGAIYSYGDLFIDTDSMVQGYFSRIQEKLWQQGIAKVEVKILHGNAAGAIIDFAQETSHNLVAMTTHGLSGIRRWALGSVTDRVAHYCGDPMLVVRAVEEASE